jgi:hypothetical protein
MSAAERDAVMNQLVVMLRNDDAKADRLLNENAVMLMGIWPEQIRALRQAVREYDFELALQLLPPGYNTPDDVIHA